MMIHLRTKRNKKDKELNDYFVTIFNIHLSELYYRYFQTSIVALLLIGGGFKLLLGNKENKGGTSE